MRTRQNQRTYKDLVEENDALRERIEELEAQNRWHPIRSAEDLPEKNGTYFITLEKFGVRETSLMKFDGDLGWEFADTNWKVTAWRKLPKPYKPEGE